MPTSITGPDNNEYDFPDGTTKDEAISYFKSKGIGGDIQSRPSQTSAPVTEAVPSVPPKFLQRFSESTGVPTTKEGLQSVQPTTADKVGMALTGPVYPLAKMAYGYGKKVLEKGKESGQEIKDAATNIVQGQPVLPNLGKAGAAETDFLLKGVLSPVGGEGVSNFGTDIANKNYQAAAGDAVGSVVNALLLKGRKPQSEATKTAKLGFATGSSGGTVSALEHVMPEIDKTVAVTGVKPKTVGEFAQAVKDTSTRLEQPFNIALQKSAAQQVVPTQIADALRAKADTLPPTAKAEIQALHNAATIYDQPWSIKDLNAERMYRNSLSRPYYNKSGSAQMAAMRSNADMMIDKIVADQSRDVLYSELDKANPGSNFGKNKQSVSHLLDLMDKLNERVEQLKDSQAQFKGAPLLDKPGVSAYAHKNNITPGIHLGSVISSVVGRGPEGSAAAAVRSAYKNPMAMNSAARAAVLAMPLRTLSPDQEAVPPSMKMKPINEDIQSFIDSLPK